MGVVFLNEHNSENERNLLWKKTNDERTERNKFSEDFEQTIVFLLN